MQIFYEPKQYFIISIQIYKIKCEFYVKDLVISKLLEEKISVYEVYKLSTKTQENSFSNQKKAFYTVLVMCNNYEIYTFAL